MFAGDVYKFLDGSADAAFVVTLEGEICFWSAAAEQLFGYTAENVLNKTCHEVLQGKSSLGAAVCQGECSVQHCAVHGRPVAAFDLEVTTRSGKRIWVNISTIIFEDSRLHRCLIAHLAHDISDRKQVEHAFARMVDLSKEVISVSGGKSGLAPIQSLSEQEERILSFLPKRKTPGKSQTNWGSRYQL